MRDGSPPVKRREQTFDRSWQSSIAPIERRYLSFISSDLAD
jgi:hypothetical protein